EGSSGSSSLLNANSSATALSPDLLHIAVEMPHPRPLFPLLHQSIGALAGRNTCGSCSRGLEHFARPDDSHNGALFGRLSIVEVKIGTRSLEQRLGDEEAKTEPRAFAGCAASGGAGRHIWFAKGFQKLR